MDISAVVGCAVVGCGGVVVIHVVIHVGISVGIGVGFSVGFSVGFGGRIGISYGVVVCRCHLSLSCIGHDIGIAIGFVSGVPLAVSAGIGSANIC